MSKSAPSPLPDLEDAEYAAKLRPLRDAVIPKDRTSGETDTGDTGNMASQPSEYCADGRKSDATEAPKSFPAKSRISVAKHIEHIEQLRGPKRRFEFLIPGRVGAALANDAGGRGKSAATRLLEVLRDAGYPVIPEDFVDLRKEKGRG